MKTKSTTLGLFLGTEVREELLAIDGPDQPIAVAMILEDCLGDFDLTDPEHAGTRLLFDKDFSFLIPEQRRGTFLSISTLVATNRRGNEPKGDAENNHVSQDRLRKLLAAVKTLEKQICTNAALTDGALVA